MKKQQAKLNKIRRQKRLRTHIAGTAARPRLHVSKSLTNLYLQLINDEKGVTLVSAHTREVKEKGSKVALAEAVGKLLAERAQAQSITTVVFDRAGNRYTGRVKAAADGARAGGLVF